VRTTTAPPPNPPPATGERPYGYKPWILVGSGGVVAVVGAILVPVGSSAVSSAQTTCPSNGSSNVCPNTVPGNAAASSGNTGRSEIGAGGALLGVGLAAAAGGLVWQFVFNKPGSAPPPATTGFAPRPTWLTPSVGKDGSGVVLGGAF